MHSRSSRRVLDRVCLQVRVAFGGFVLPVAEHFSDMIESPRKHRSQDPKRPFSEEELEANRMRRVG